MKIGILKKKAFSAVDYYRLLPWILLDRMTEAQVVGIDMKVHNEYDIASLDVLVAHSPNSKLETHCILSAKELGVKLIIDYDDLVFDVSDVNPAHQVWGREETQISAIELLMEADAVTVSTIELVKEFSNRFGVNAFLIMNALNDASLKVWPDAKIRKNPLILWRGSNTHDGDLYKHRDAFVPLDNTEYLFFGFKPARAFGRQYGGHLDTIPFRIGTPWILAYFPAILQISPTYMVVPLEDTLFNRCKSNIAWQEATWAGAVTIAPSFMPEFSDVSCIHYDDVDDLKRIFQRIDEGQTHEDVLQQARDELQERYLISNVNHKRVNLLNRLLSDLPVVPHA